ncbi:DUF2147 domain-containing protein [Prosthecomicrobium hirschii]|uniref:DUF2147 domain-containing protein n=1 Tax=Prosthecodimorpha hirschii TaxID=665126 RepID=UPI002220770E|nr:DUF2147 domain-containing protein [Prosthecomicrobium hirschii]MCW1843946.1 DUF2147 domain-containing protein [Prosthecomicrobium hirschii]
MIAVRIAWLAGVAVAAGLSTLAGARAMETAAGDWAQADDKTGKIRSHVRIVERGGVFSGHVQRVYPDPGESSHPICDKCPGRLKNQPIVGMTFMRGFRRDGNTYTGGTVLDPEDGNIYQGTMTLSPDGHSLTLRGYVGTPLFGRSQVWRRIR